MCNCLPQNMCVNLLLVLRDSQTMEINGQRYLEVAIDHLWPNIAVQLCIHHHDWLLLFWCFGYLKNINTNTVGIIDFL